MMASNSPSPAASEQQDLPSPGVGEDFRRRRLLDKYWKKYGVAFFAIRSLPYKGGPQTMPEGLDIFVIEPWIKSSPDCQYNSRNQDFCVGMIFYSN